jgi:hypothetical protein
VTVKATDKGIKQVVDAIGDSTYYGITVEGHCMGIVGRTWRDPTQSSGYAYACDGAKAVANAGKMRSGTPPKGSVVWFSTGGGTYARPGHVLTMKDDVVTVGNIGTTIQRRDIGAWTLPRIGWCWPEDVPSWGKSPTPGGGGTTPPPATDDYPIECEDDMYIFRTHQDGTPDGQGVGNGAAYMVFGYRAVQCAPGFLPDPEIDVVKSSSEAMDNAFYASVTRYRL